MYCSEIHFNSISLLNEVIKFQVQTVIWRYPHWERQNRHMTGPGWLGLKWEGNIYFLQLCNSIEFSFKKILIFFILVHYRVRKDVKLIFCIFFSFRNVLNIKIEGSCSFKSHVHEYQWIFSVYQFWEYIPPILVYSIFRCKAT